MSGLVGYVDSVVAATRRGLRSGLLPDATGGDDALGATDVQRLRPEMDAFPTNRVDDTALGQDEDVAEPLLNLNA